MKRALYWLPVGLGVIFLLALAYLQRDRALRGQNDFAQLYAGATLAGSPQLYEREANLAVIQAHAGMVMESVVYTRPPFFAVLLKPLALLPYSTAYAIFSLVSLACALWFVIRFSKECPPLPFFAAMSIPVVSALCGGQDTLFLLVIVGAAILLTRQGRDMAAGAVLSLAAIKFHLFLCLPLLLLMKRRWRILSGGLAGTAFLTALGCAVAGVDSIERYLQVLRDPWINPSASIMPNLHGLVAILGGGTTSEAILVAATLLGCGWLTWRSDDFEFLLAASLACGLLVSFHSGIADDVLLLPAFVCVFRAPSPPSLRVAAGLILTPIPYFMVLADAPYSAFFPICLLLMFGLFCIAAMGTRKPTPAPVEATPTA